MRIIALIAVLPLAACSLDSGDSGPGIAGTGSGTTRNFAVTDFTGIALRGSDDVDVRVGSGFSVRAEGPNAELDKLRIVRDGDTLAIGRKDSSGFSWGDRHEGVKIYVTMPRIVEAAIAGSGDMTIDRVEGERFKGATAGSGSLTIPLLAVRSGDFAVAGSGDMTLRGSAKQLEVAIMGSGDIDAAGLKATGAKVSIAGSGGLKADVAGAASVSMVGSGDADLGRRARCTISKVGSGEVRCG